MARRRKRKREKGALSEADPAAASAVEPPAASGASDAGEVPTAGDELAPFQARL